MWTMRSQVRMMMSDVLSFDDGGTFTVSWPRRISADEARDILEYLELLKRKIPTFVANPPAGGSQPNIKESG